MLDDENGSTQLSPLCSFRAERDQDTVTIRLHGEFDLSCEERFQKELRRFVGNGTSELTLDLRELAFMDSTGLRMLLALDANARSDGLDFAVLCRAEGPVRKILRETGLDEVLPVDPGGVIVR